MLPANACTGPTPVPGPEEGLPASPLHRALLGPSGPLPARAREGDAVVTVQAQPRPCAGSVRFWSETSPVTVLTASLKRRRGVSGCRSDVCPSWRIWGTDTEERGHRHSGTCRSARPPDVCVWWPRLSPRPRTMCLTPVCTRGIHSPPLKERGLSRSRLMPPGEEGAPTGVDGGRCTGVRLSLPRPISPWAVWVASPRGGRWAGAAGAEPDAEVPLSEPRARRESSDWLWETRVETRPGTCCCVFRRLVLPLRGRT